MFGFLKFESRENIVGEVNKWIIYVKVFEQKFIELAGKKFVFIKV